MILFRAEAGPAVGAGHVMRCLAVARAVRALGGEAGFAVDASALATAPALARGGLALFGPEPRPCDVVLLDGYGLTADDEAAWAALGAGVAVFEDAPGRPHAADLLIDPAPGRTEADYRAAAPAARLLLGPAYAPLGRPFTEARAGALARRETAGPIRRVLVSTGLTDAASLAPRAVRAALAFDGVERIDVAVGAAATSLTALRAIAAHEPRVRLHIDAENMADLTARADVALGAAGTSSWERCALGLPSVVALAAGNQAHNARMLTATGAALVVGADGFGSGLAALASAEARRAMSRAASTLVDGDGAQRIAVALIGLA